MKKVLIVSSGVILSSCFRTSINELPKGIIIKQYCSFDNLDAGFYQIKDLNTGEIKRIDVDIRDCDIYKVGDTIK